MSLIEKGILPSPYPPIPVTIHSRFEGSYQNMLTDLLTNAMHRVVATTKYKRNVYYMKRLVEIAVSTSLSKLINS